MFPVLLGVWDEHSWLRSRESAELYDTLTAMTANERCESLFFAIDWYNMIWVFFLPDFTTLYFRFTQHLISERL